MQKTTTELMADAQDLDKKINALLSRISEVQRELTLLQGEAADLNATKRSIVGEIERRSRPAEKPSISEHALLRYIERVVGVDLDALREHILTPRIATAIQAGATSVTVEGITFRVKDNTIVTLISGPQKSPKKVRRGRQGDPNSIEEQLAEFYEEQAGAD